MCISLSAVMACIDPVFLLRRYKILLLQEYETLLGKDGESVDQLKQQSSRLCQKLGENGFSHQIRRETQAIETQVNKSVKNFCALISLDYSFLIALFQ